MLDIDFTTVIFQVANFLILVVLLYFLLFKKILKRAENRKDELNHIRQAAEENFLESEKIRSELEGSINNFNSNLEEHISDAKSELEVIRHQVVSEIKSESEQIFLQTQDDVNLAQKQSIHDFHLKILGVALEVSKKLLAGSTTIEIHENLIKQITESVWEKGKKEMRQVETIRKSLVDREPTLFVTTAIPISKELQGSIIRTFSALADKNINLEINQDKSLISGARIRLGDYIVENSLSSKLEEIKDSVAKELQTQINNEFQI